MHVGILFSTFFKSHKTHSLLNSLHNRRYVRRFRILALLSDTVVFFRLQFICPIMIFPIGIGASVLLGVSTRLVFKLLRVCRGKSLSPVLAGVVGSSTMGLLGVIVLRLLVMRHEDRPS